MYITQDIANRIKLTTKSREIPMKELLSSCGLNINAVSEFSKGKQLSCISLAKIADQLDCSVDYLLGRTENIDSTYSINNQNSTINGTQANVINNSNEHQDDMTEEFIKAFEKLDFADKVAVMNFAISKLDK